MAPDAPQPGRERSADDRLAAATARLTEAERREVADFAEFLEARHLQQNGTPASTSEQPLQAAHLRGSLQPWADKIGTGVDFQHAARDLRKEQTDPGVSS